MAAINVGNKIDASSYESIVKGIEKIFEFSEKYHIDEVTTRHALEILKGAAGVSGVSITNSSFTGEFTDDKKNSGSNTDGDGKCEG